MDISRNVYDTARNNLFAFDQLDAELFSRQWWNEFERLEELDSFTPVGFICIDMIKAAAGLLKLMHERGNRAEVINGVVHEMLVKYCG